MTARLHTGFLKGPGGHIPLSVFAPPPDVATSRWILHVPAFAEEMNKCRPMVARQARRFAEGGAVVIVPDLAGTGDSEWGFEQSDWQLWVQEVHFLLQWSAEQGTTAPLLWGVRLGCLLAIQALQESPSPVAGLLMWQPVLSGAPHMNQFLRLRTAAQMMQGAAESVSDLKARLAAQEQLEIAGYPLPPALFADLEQSAASEMVIPVDCPVVLHEVVAEAAKPLLPVTDRQVSAWAEAGVQCQAQAVVGSPFWLTQEIGFAPLLLDATGDAVAAITPGAAPFAPASLPAHFIDLDGIELRARVFECEGQQLAAQLQLPARAGSTAVLVVVGGPQYRVGSHRQFQQLAGALAGQGIPVMRFDYRGMGDSGGELTGFLHVKDDIRRALDTLFAEVPGLQSVVLWGLCDAATACASYASADARVSGMVLANPWVYSEAGEARAYLKHYYRERLFSADLWRKLLRGDFDLRASLQSLLGFVRRAGGGAVDGTVDEAVDEIGKDEAASVSADEQVDLGALFSAGLKGFDGSLLLLISGNDLTAAQFLDTLNGDKSLARRLSQRSVKRVDLAGADHTFSAREDSERVEQESVNYLLGR